MNRTVLADLARALRVLGHHGETLAPATATTEQLHEIAEDIARARRLLAAAERPAPTTDCPEHPNGPVEPGTDRQCLLCRNRRHRADAADEAPGIPVTVVLSVVEELGEEAATQMYGGRVVAKALAASHPRPVPCRRSGSAS